MDLLGVQNSRLESQRYQASETSWILESVSLVVACCGGEVDCVRVGVEHRKDGGLSKYLSCRIEVGDVFDLFCCCIYSCSGQLRQDCRADRAKDCLDDDSLVEGVVTSD